MEDINQLELTAYIIVISREIVEYSDKTIDNYIDLLEDEFEIIPVRAILDKVHIKLYDKINPRHSLNFQECINYAKLIFYYLLQHSDKQFSEKEIISVAESVYRNNSVRNAEEKVIEFRL